MTQRSSTQIILLQPFFTENTPEECHISTLLSNDGSSLKVTFELTSRLADLKIPDFKRSDRKRSDKLWEHTCFEIFLGRHGMPNYWEFNLSPSGEWNVYSFSGYRQGMKREISFDTLPFEVKIPSGQVLKLKTAIDLKFFQSFSDINVGLSAVLERNDGNKSYWAVSHPGDTPDFHAREGWL